MGKKSKKGNKTKQKKDSSAAGAASGNTFSGRRNVGSSNARGSFLSVTEHSDLIARCFEKSIKPLTPEDAVGRVGKGMGLSTQIVEFLGGKHANTSHRRYLNTLVDAGLVSTVLGLLSKCEEGDISDIVDAGGLPFDENFLLKSRGEVMEGHVGSPKVWIDILLRLATGGETLGLEKMRECRVEIAKGIKPLAECLCDDMERECFARKQHWYDAFVPFVTLVHWLIGRTCDIDYAGDITIPILIKYKGFLETLVRCMFWAQERPDIMQESKEHESVLKKDNFAWIADMAGATINPIMKSHELEDDHKFYYAGPGYECNMRIGSTLIVNEEYNPDCKIPFISGLISILDGSITNEVTKSEAFMQRSELFNMMKILLVTDCVDKEGTDTFLGILLCKASNILP